MYRLEYLEEDKIVKSKKYDSFEEAVGGLKYIMGRRGFGERIIYQTVAKREDYLDEEDSFQNIYVHYVPEEGFLKLEMSRGHEGYRIGVPD